MPGTIKTASPGHPPHGRVAEAWAEVRAPPLIGNCLPSVSAPSRHFRGVSATLSVDIGCGAGKAVLQLAQEVGPHGRVIGVDIAPLLIAIARERARNLPQTSFIESDALVLDPLGQSMYAVFSRFSVMAFADPVATFANIQGKSCLRAATLDP